MKLKTKNPHERPDSVEGSASERLLFGGPLLYNARWADHRDAYFRMSLWAMALQLPRLVAFTVRLAWRADRRAMWTVGAGELTRGISQAVGLVAVNSVLATVLATGTIEHRVRAAIPAMIGVAITGIIGAVASAASTSGTGRLEPKVERVATEMYLTRVSNVELSAIEDAGFNRLMDSARIGASEARRMVGSCTGVVGSLVSFVAAAGVLTVLHPALLPLLVLMTLPRSWASLRNSRARYASYQQWMQHSRAGRLLGDSLMRTGPAPEIRVHGVGPFLLHHFRRMSEAYETEQSRLASSRARVRLVASALTGIAATLTYIALGTLLATGMMALSVAGTAVLAIRTGGQSLSTLVLQVNNLYEQACYVQDLERLFLEAARQAIPVGGMPVPDDLALIRFENVTFHYPADNDPAGNDPADEPEDTRKADRPALRDVTLDIPMGKIVALVGENGSGKTTVSRLLAGLYHPDDGGVIRWNGVDARDLDRAQLWDRIAVVGQDFHRWPFTCRMNIAIGRAERPMDEQALEGAAAYAGADKVVAELPRGWDTLLTKGYKGGRELSGGQWQKLGIARARYRDAQILIVDEPTSALDAKAELEVFDQIRKLADGGQTVVLITHRLASVRHADLIHVLEDGELRESGTFEELHHHPTAGVFRELYEMQRAQFQDAVVPGQRRPGETAGTGKGKGSCDG
ncbi:ABC transporter ATP-binding protein [Streptomyces griseocarneus]|uniref:ABC transporter ATP-binding protein n=1 Tax=Streptomyces griseocarneus TaxID=51201 RepID=UPI00167E2E51|nr:ABC transporter ATP-binding protein [Streptomyces griseocarneus]MBZ6475156.1 ABC transporter ATP-binding protein/permease [Streptomyces griseocarneus]GHG61945.1 multidrug ABC transporter permease [Streptomyces griseocarneus]